MKKIEGGYYCGYITYEATVNPDLVVICHCTDCQTLSGTTFRIGVFAPQGNFKLLTGAPKFYLKTTASGTKRKLAFCPECGTSIYSSDTSDAPVFWIRVGTCRQRAELIPKFPDLVPLSAELGAEPGGAEAVSRAAPASSLIQAADRRPAVGCFGGVRRAEPNSEGLLRNKMPNPHHIPWIPAGACPELVEGLE